MERMSFYGLAGRKFQEEATASQCPESKSLDDDESWSTLSVNALLAQFRAGKGVEESSVDDSDSDSMSTVTVHTISTDTDAIRSYPPESAEFFSWTSARRGQFLVQTRAKVTATGVRSRSGFQ
jgi:hypothetical protein